MEIIYLSGKDDSLWQQAGELLEEMYGQMAAQGLEMVLAKDGKEKWIESARQSSGRFGITLAAKDGGALVAFAQGGLKFLPAYLGEGLTGVVLHIYVRDGQRLQGIGKALLHSLEEWFGSKQVTSIELQVISGNLPAMEFWKRNGYTEELRQFRKWTGTVSKDLTDS
jgi:GNAT superfamily N-acetyltransferase